MMQGSLLGITRLSEEIWDFRYNVTQNKELTISGQNSKHRATSQLLFTSKSVDWFPYDRNRDLKID